VGGMLGSSEEIRAYKQGPKIRGIAGPKVTPGNVRAHSFAKRKGILGKELGYVKVRQAAGRVPKTFELMRA